MVEEASRIGRGFEFILASAGQVDAGAVIGEALGIAATARRTFGAIEELFSSCIAAAQRAGDIKQDADPARLAGLLLAVLRGIEALGKGGSSPDSLRAIAETALALLPVP
ncbi:hypothetical protein [Streptomyces sp. NPDC058614]|uniref:hypothetical protein n=1 Tax=Streptomyces sp. NPDC058614 TaxID=3346557 RepID=UPI00364EA2C1